MIEFDHAPVILDLSFPLNSSDRAPWRFDTALLIVEGFCKIISTATDNFLETNNNNISPSLLWQTLKVVIKGDIIYFTSRVNKAREQEQEQLLSSIFDILSILGLSHSRTL